MLQFAIESTDRSATAYIAGSLSISGFWQVMRACDDLPADIRSLRVDLQAVRVVQDGVFEETSAALRTWREARQGSTRVDLPRSGLGILGNSAPHTISADSP